DEIPVCLGNVREDGADQGTDGPSEVGAADEAGREEQQAEQAANEAGRPAAAHEAGDEPQEQQIGHRSPLPLTARGTIGAGKLNRQRVPAINSAIRRSSGAIPAGNRLEISPTWLSRIRPERSSRKNEGQARTPQACQVRYSLSWTTGQVTPSRVMARAR